MILVKLSLILVQTDVEHRHRGHHKEGGEHHHKVGGEQQQGERGLDLTSEILNSNLVGRDTVEVRFLETHLLLPHTTLSLTRFSLQVKMRMKSTVTASTRMAKSTMSTKVMKAGTPQ